MFGYSEVIRIKVVILGNASLGSFIDVIQCVCVCNTPQELLSTLSIDSTLELPQVVFFQKCSKHSIGSAQLLVISPQIIQITTDLYSFSP